MTHERIETNPDVMGGKPVIRGTRIPVETILRKLGAGVAVAAILADHPRLTEDDIRAAQGTTGCHPHPAHPRPRLRGDKTPAGVQRGGAL